MQERRGFRLRLFLGAVPAALVGIVLVGAALRLVPVSPVAWLGLVSLFVAGGVAFAAAKKRWDVALAVILTVLALYMFIVWLTSNVVGNID